MLVYGRQEYSEPLGRMLQQLAERAVHTRAQSLDDFRALLIQTGQLEQGAEDYLESGALIDCQLVKSISQLSEQAAMLFLKAWGEANPELDFPSAGRVRTLADFSESVRRLQEPHAAPLPIKIPEGFEYYALFPEQYCLAARRWAAERAGTWSRKVLVVGIRSIGTSLSALVAAVLAGQGWLVERRTVRPTGPPFAREVKLERADLNAYSCAVVVDEGPGLSGSSMAATARALAQTGIRDISFLPGHAGEPGSAASPETRRWWSETPRYVAGLADLGWGGLDLAASLAERTRALGAPGGNGSGSQNVEDLSGGLWRRRAFANENEWPAALTRFERTKYLCASYNGNALLWKFAGLGCVWQGGKTSQEIALERMAKRVDSGLVPEVVESFRGFNSTRWIEGTRLKKGHVRDPAVLAHASHYLLQSAGHPLDGAEATMSLARLTEMLYANTREALGESLADQARCWAEAIKPAAAVPSYGDGRLAPHEWVRTRTGALLKTDPTGHDLDHTLVGKQPLLWDVAGLLVEWDVDTKAAAPLLCPLERAGIAIPADALAFYQMSYAAFRIGVSTLCAGELPPEAEERKRLQAASEMYRSRLQQLIHRLPE